MIKFYRFFDFMNRNGLNKTDVTKQLGISTATAAKLFAGKNVSMSVIENICKTYGLQPGDIMEYIQDDN